MPNLGEFSWNWILGDRTQVEKEKQQLIRRDVFASSIKPEVWHFRVVDV